MNDFHFQEQSELFPLTHRPILPAREGHDGEQVFSSMWEAAMALPGRVYLHEEPLPIQLVLSNFRKPITQWHASILASVVTWLGTACGEGVLSVAERIQNSGACPSPHYAYLMAWSVINHRHVGVNYGIRSVEFLLARPEQRRQVRGIMDTGLRELPELSADDLEVIDHLMVWLAESEGQRFLTRCKAKLAGLERERHVLRAADAIRSHNERVYR